MLCMYKCLFVNKKPQQLIHVCTLFLNVTAHSLVSNNELRNFHIYNHGLCSVKCHHIHTECFFFGHHKHTVANIGASSATEPNTIPNVTYNPVLVSW